MTVIYCLTTIYEYGKILICKWERVKMNNHIMKRQYSDDTFNSSLFYCSGPQAFSQEIRIWANRPCSPAGLFIYRSM